MRTAIGQKVTRTRVVPAVSPSHVLRQGGRASSLRCFSVCNAYGWLTLLAAAFVLPLGHAAEPGYDVPLPPYKRVVEPAASPSEVEKQAQQKASAQTARVKEFERKLAAAAEEKATREARAAAIAENNRQLAEAKRLRLAKAAQDAKNAELSAKAKAKAEQDAKSAELAAKAKQEQDAKDAEMAAKVKAKAEQDARSAELAAKAKQEQDAQDAELAAKVKREQDAQEAELTARTKAKQSTPTLDLDACKATFQNQFSVFVKSNRFKAPDTLSNFFFYIRTPNGSNDCIDCRSGVAKQLGAWLGVRINTLIDPGGNRRYSSGCIGYREDFFGSRDGATCIAKFLGPGYHVDQTCNYQFFPYAIAINP